MPHKARVTGTLNSTAQSHNRVTSIFTTSRIGLESTELLKYAELAGIGHKTGVDLPNESQGTMPSTKWKMRMFRQKWYAGETISVGIGQGAVTVSPVQLAAALGGVGGWREVV